MSGVNELVQIVVGIISVISAALAVIHRINSYETMLSRVQVELRQQLRNEFQFLEGQLNNHLSAYEERKEHIDYMINSLREEIKHKTQRLQELIKEK